MEFAKPNSSQYLDAERSVKGQSCRKNCFSSVHMSSIGVGGTRAFLKNALIPTQLHTTFHLMVTNFRSCIFWSRIFDLVFLIWYFENLFVI